VAVELAISLRQSCARPSEPRVPVPTPPRAADGRTPRVIVRSMSEGGVLPAEGYSGLHPDYQVALPVGEMPSQTTHAQRADGSRKQPSAVTGNSGRKLRAETEEGAPRRASHRGGLGSISVVPSVHLRAGLPILFLLAPVRVRQPVIHYPRRCCPRPCRSPCDDAISARDRRGSGRSVLLPMLATVA